MMRKLPFVEFDIQPLLRETNPLAKAFSPMDYVRLCDVALPLLRSGINITVRHISPIVGRRITPWKRLQTTARSY